MTISPSISSLRIDESGTIRIGSSRVTLDTIVAGFNQGMTPEQIAQDFSTLALADLYSAIGYYLAHQRELDEYLAHSAGRAEAFRRNSPDLYAADVRQKLLARAVVEKAG